MRPSKAIDLLVIAAASAAAILMQSCAAGRPPAGRPATEDGAAAARPAAEAGLRTVITGRVKIDFPEYRVRGSCRILSEADGTVRIDFLHSSLFGSYREDATLQIGGGEIILEDHERDSVWAADSTLALMKRISGFDVLPDDLLFILLIAVPESTGEGSVGSGGGRPGSVSSGTWRGRDIEVSRDEGGRTLIFRQCRKDISLCYTARYAYNGGGRYPSRIVLERDPGGERISLTVTDVREEGAAPGRDKFNSP